MRRKAEYALLCGLCVLALASSARPLAREVDKPTASAGAAKKPLKVFVLAGQSNMEGQAVVDLDHEKYYNGGRGTLKHLLKDPTKAKRLAHLRQRDGRWTVRDDVWVRYQPTKGALKAGRLSIGFGAYEGKHHFGPELQFGHVLGDAIAEPILLIKTAWGGKSLHRDFRPPSAGGDVGPFYKKMITEIRQTLERLEAELPECAGREHEFAGFVWFQGWNDMVTEGALDAYEENLAHLIRDVRDELGAPRLPVVIGETGNADQLKLRNAQRAVAKRKEFRESVAFVETRAFLRKAEDSPNVGHGHHWFGNAESYFLIGDAMGRAMKDLLDLPR